MTIAWLEKNTARGGEGWQCGAMRMVMAKVYLRIFVETLVKDLPDTSVAKKEFLGVLPDFSSYAVFAETFGKKPAVPRRPLPPATRRRQKRTTVVSLKRTWWATTVAISDDTCVCNRRISRMARISRHRRRRRHLYLPSSRRSSTSSSSSVVISLQHRAGRWRYYDEKGANRQPKKTGPSLRRSSGWAAARCRSEVRLGLA